MKGFPRSNMYPLNTSSWNLLYQSSTTIISYRFSYQKTPNICPKNLKLHLTLSRHLKGHHLDLILLVQLGFPGVKKPRKTNMVHLKMNPWKGRVLLETIIFRFQPLVFGGVYKSSVDGEQQQLQGGDATGTSYLFAVKPGIKSLDTPNGKRTGLAGKSTMNEDGFPIQHGDSPLSCSFSGGYLWKLSCHFSKLIL